METDKSLSKYYKRFLQKLQLQKSLYDLLSMRKNVYKNYY